MADGDAEPPRRRVCGRFRVLERVGTGGFAEVWRGVDGDGRPVAVKFPRTDRAAGDGTGRDDVGGDGTDRAADAGTDDDDPDAGTDDAGPDPATVRRGFERARRALSAFEGGVHPTSLVRFLDGRREPPCLVTEFVAGESLPRALDARSVTPGPAAVRRYGLPVVRALSTLHANGYAYLDCTPDNVLVRAAHDRPVLVDFNAAEPAAGPDPGTATLFGPDPYKAPEQTSAARGPSGPWSDVYAAGRLLGYLLTGDAPAAGGPPPSAGADAPPSSAGADAPDAGDGTGGTADRLAGVLGRATAPDPGDRPRDCRALADDLYRALGRDPARATLTDARTAVACPARPGDTVGRVVEGGDDAAGVADAGPEGDGERGSDDGPGGVAGAGSPADPDRDGPPRFLAADAELPTLAVADPERYVSPVQFVLERDDGGWLVADRSLNGTFFHVGDRWRLVLGDRGYRHLAARGHPRVAGDGDRPPGKLRAVGPTRLAPVDPSYPVRLRFDPRAP